MLSFVNSVQSRKRRQNIVSRMFGNVKHVNFYVTTVNSMLPMKLHPFPSLIKFLMTQLAKSGTIRGKDWAEKLASRNESLALFKADISSKVGCSYAVRLELGYVLKDDLIENVLRAWRALGGESQVDADEARNAIYDLSRLRLVRRPLGHHFSLLNFVRLNCPEHEVAEGIGLISKKPSSVSTHHFSRSGRVS